MTKQDETERCLTQGATLKYEITPAMIKAGLEELYEHFRLSGDWADLVSKIYLAMALEGLEPSGQVLEANADLSQQR